MGHENIVSALINHGASPNTTNVVSLSPNLLFFFSFKCCVFAQIMSVCVLQRGETALHMAARAGQADVVRYLLKNGAKVDTKSKVGTLSSALSHFTKTDLIWVHKLPSTSVQDDQTALHISSRLGKIDIVQQLLHCGASANAATTSGYTPLHLAAREGHEDVATMLLENGASLSSSTKASNKMKIYITNKKNPTFHIPGVNLFRYHICPQEGVFLKLKCIKGTAFGNVD